MDFLQLPRDAHLHLPHIPLLSHVRTAVLVEGDALHTPTMSISRRAPAAASSSQAACTSSANGDTCQKPTDASATLPIALGVVIPITAALVAFFFLHRRYKRKLRAEDRADEEKYKSMDFGMDLGYQRKGKKENPEALRTGGRDPRQMKGLSMEAGSPYLFPGGKGSKESLASLARETYDADHRYRQAPLPGQLGKGDDMSIRSATPLGRRGTEASSNEWPYDGASNTNLLGHAQSHAKSLPPRGASIPSPSEPPTTYKHSQEPDKAIKTTLPPVLQIDNQSGLAPAFNDPTRSSYVDHAAFRQSNQYLREAIHSREPSDDNRSTPASINVESNESTIVASFDSSPKFSVAEISATHDASRTVVAPDLHTVETETPVDPRDTFYSTGGSIYDANNTHVVQRSHVNSYLGEENFQDIPFNGANLAPSHFTDLTSTHDILPFRGESSVAPLSDDLEHRESQYHDDSFGPVNYNTNRLSILTRPLPPDDPTENPEERANRIRSFYKEYFDESKMAHQQHAPMPESMPQYDYNQYSDYNQYPEHVQQHSDHNQVDYYEDYDTEYSNNAYGMYDNQQQGFVVAAPFAQPITRRAMTPPPRAPPRFHTQDRERSSFAMSPGMPPRGQSSMSNYRPRPGPGSDRGRTANRAPPPQPLLSLKTPHLLKDDSALYSAFDLAPPPSFRDRQQGRRPDSPLGVQRPYSPSVRAHVPLNSAFEELSPMPSPHLLRRSGTFTGLDFAPPQRLRGVDAGSDAGSIRSGKSGMSAAQVYALRSGAHRISRVPKQLLGTKDDIMQGLKPSWDLRY